MIISIHAPRVGCDPSFSLSDFLGLDFNPRTPGGVRQPLLCMLYPNIEFQSTHPGWGATLPRLVTWTIRQISIHAPRVGCDRSTVKAPRCKIISIHAPRVGCDQPKKYTI